MKILLVARLYSGFEESLIRRSWNPAGLPSMYNFINYFDKSSDLNIIFTAKDSGSTYKSQWKYKNDIIIKLPSFRNSVHVIAGINYFPAIIHRKIAMIFRDIRQALKILVIVRRVRPSIIYCDSANVIPASILTILSSRPVVLRVLGACSYWWSIIDSKRLVDRVYKYAYLASFSLVIGTEDGSGMDAWFDNVLQKSTPRTTLLNGVSSKIYDGSTPLDASLKNIKRLKANDYIIISFVGRLETYKGVSEFFSAAVSLINKNKYHLHFLVVGDGSLYADLLKTVHESGVDSSFTFFGSVEHRYINNIHSVSDIYVSTNYDGNLTNANLEAIANDQCMLIVDRSKHAYIDISTRKILGDSVLYFNAHPEGLYLRNELNKLLANPVDIDSHKSMIKHTKRKFVKTWDQRMQEEHVLLQNLVEK